MSTSPLSTSQGTGGNRFSLEPRIVLAAIGAAMLLLLVLHMAGTLMRVHYGPDFARAFQRMFDMDAEGNMPTLFSTALLALNALLFWFAWRASRAAGTREPFWLLMSLLFVFLACDELGTLHEHFVRPLRAMLPSTAGGLFRFAWVIPYGIAAVVLAALCLPVLRRVGNRFSALFVLCGVVYLTGALGFEMLGGRYLEMTNTGALAKSPGYVLLTTVEEVLEMGGLALLAYTLLTLLQERMEGFSVSLASRGAAPARAPLQAPVTAAVPSSAEDPTFLAWKCWVTSRPGVSQPTVGSSKITCPGA
jgi:hypothetical protein